MKKYWTLYVPLLVFVLLASFFFYALEYRKTNSSRVKLQALQGQIIPEFELPALEPNLGLINPKQLSNGQPYLLNIWATWCPTCYVEHPYLMELKAQGVRIIGLNYKDNDQQARRWLQESGNPYQFNIVDKSGRFGIDLGVTGAPETYLLDANNRIHFKREGDMNPSVWREQFASIYQQLLNNNQPLSE